MVYLPGIPNATDIPAQSQPQLKENFTQLNTQFKAEHNAFDSGAADGHHLAVTLPQNPTVAAPAGTDWQLIHDLAGGKETLDVKYAGPAYFHIPLRHLSKPAVNIAHHFTGTLNILDFATINIGADSSGTILLYDNNNFTRTVFSPFVYTVGTLYIPVGSGQLTAGTTFTKVGGLLSMLQLVVDDYDNPGGFYPSTVTVVVTESRTK